MNVHRIEDLINDLINNSEFPPYVTGGVSEDRIRSVEKAMGLKFCQDYVDYLTAFGKIELNIHVFFGISINRGDNEGGQVLYETERFFDDVLGKKMANTTLLMADDCEWYVVLNHETQKTVPYDPFSKSFVTKMEKSLEEYLVEELDY